MRESAKVQPLHEQPVDKVVATGFNLVINLAGERQITFQSGYEGDETEEAVYARIDRMMKIGDRYKARYSIPEMEKDLATQEATLANLLVDKARLDVEFEAAQAARLEEIEKCKETANGHILDLGKRKNEVEKAGQDDWASRGRRGEYKPQGASKVEVDRLDSAMHAAAEARDKAIAGIQLDIDKAKAERERAEENQQISLVRWTDAIEKMKADLARMRQLAGT